MLRIVVVLVVITASLVGAQIASADKYMSHAQANRAARQILRGPTWRATLQDCAPKGRPMRAGYTYTIWTCYWESSQTGCTGGFTIRGVADNSPLINRFESYSYYEDEC
jgi:hypothetical protein